MRMMARVVRDRTDRRLERSRAGRRQHPLSDQDQAASKGTNTGVVATISHPSQPTSQKSCKYRHQTLPAKLQHRIDGTRSILGLFEPRAVSRYGTQYDHCDITCSVHGICHRVGDPCGL